MDTRIPDNVQLAYGTSDLDEIKNLRRDLKSVHKGVTMECSAEKISADTVRDLCKNVGIEYLDGYENRIVKFVISTEDVDRASDVVIQRGIEIDDYMKNPVILFAHNSGSLPIGATLKITKSKKGTTALGLFYDERVDATQTSDIVFRMIKARALRGASIGFRIIESRFPNESESKNLGMSPWGLIMEKTALFEWSVCAVPCNQNSLQTSKMFGTREIQIARNLGLVKSSDEKPYKNEHACRINDPDKYSEIRRENGDREHDGKKYDVIYGKTEDGDWEDQSYRYPNDVWTEDQAKQHCADHNGIEFEPAREKSENGDENGDEFVESIDFVDIDIKSLIDRSNTTIIIVDELKQLIHGLMHEVRKIQEHVTKSPVPQGSQEKNGDYDDLAKRLDEMISKLKN